MSTALCVRGQDMQPDQPKRAANFPKIQETSPGVLAVGGVTLDKNKKEVTFPATINMTRGLIEYYLVQEGGKTHESLLATKTEPYHLHVAMLLLGVKEQKQQGDGLPPDAIDAEYLKTAPKLQGTPVLIKVKWQENGKDVEVNAEDLVTNDVLKATMIRGPWTYNGSMLKDGMFLAQQERSLIAMITDPTALINNTRPGCENDQTWIVRTEKTPKEGMPVLVTMQIAPDTAPTAPSSTSPTPASKPTP